MATIEKRLNAEGNPVFRVKVRLKGFPLQTATFQRLTDAKDWAKITEGAIKDRRYFKNSEAKKRTVAELIDRYVADVLPQKQKSRAKQTAQLAWWKEQLRIDSFRIRTRDFGTNHWICATHGIRLLKLQSLKTFAFTISAIAPQAI